MQSLQKACVTENGENASEETAIELIKIITTAHPERDFYIGYTSINANHFNGLKPHFQTYEQFKEELRTEEEHGQISHRQAKNRFDAHKKKDNLCNFITVFRADESGDQLRAAERKILDPFLPNRHCKNRIAGGSGGMTQHFSHGYVYFAYNGSPIQTDVLQRYLQKAVKGSKIRSKSVDNRRNRNQGHVQLPVENNRPFANMQNTKATVYNQQHRPLQSLVKLCILDDAGNYLQTTIQMAINLIKIIITKYPERYFYIGYTSINANDFWKNCPWDQTEEEYCYENAVQNEHGLLTNRKIEDAKKRVYDLHQFITVYRTDTEGDLRLAKTQILGAFFDLPQCKNEKRGAPGGMSSPFKHGYVYFAYNGLPFDKKWLQACLRSLGKPRSRSVAREP